MGSVSLARQVAAGQASTEWFTQHGSTPVTELPTDWPKDYRDLVQRRIELIGADRNMGLLERPEHKRRWATDGWDKLQLQALREWLLDRLEAPKLWSDPEPLSVAQLADRMRHDQDFLAVLDLWVGRDQYELAPTLGNLVADGHVPFLAGLRYKPSGLRKRAQWERTWDQQRRDDQGEEITVEVPPRYTSADFTRPSYWHNRGKLDVPKER